MPIMTRRKWCVICSMVVGCLYTAFTIGVLNTADVSKVIALLLDLNLINGTRSARRIHGFGTIMVDVRKLGQMDFDKMGERNTTKMHLNQTKKCFQLTWKEGEYAYNNTSEVIKQSKILNRKNCKSYITLSSVGRTGNQMFQLAALLGTAYHLDLIPVINTTFPLARYFNLPNLVKHKLEHSKHFSSHRSSRYDPRVLDLDKGRNWTMDGYFQSWKYFEGLEPTIRQVFQVKDEFLEQPKQFLFNVTLKGQTNVCIHVRRGDFVTKKADARGYATADIHFLNKAIQFHRDLWQKVRFIVLSDGMDWCKKNIRGPDIMFSPFYHVAHDFALMTLCDHVVVTSGTFGWWGAWLSGGTTVYYKNYPKPGSWLETQFKRDEYYPPHWIGLT